MSSSPSLSPDKKHVTTPPASTALPFPYLAVSGHEMAENNATEDDPERNSSSLPADEAVVREERARSQGRDEALLEARQLFEKMLEKERSTIAAALSDFQRERAGYFKTIEGQVVQLALSIARKILHREAQIDPLMLAGIVRVTLEKIEGVSKISIRVNPEKGADWRKYLTMHLQPGEVPEIIEDPEQPPDRCTLATSMGSTIVGPEVQLQEVEKGLLDLMAARPGSSQ